YVLGAIADEMDVHLALPDAAAVRAELTELGGWRGARPLPPAVIPSASSPELGEHEVRLATWHQLLDAGRMQDGEPYLAGTARPVVARVSPATAAAAGVSDGEKVTVTTAAGALTIPVEVTPMADGVVWLPTASAGSAVRTDLGAGHGSRVTLRRSE
ncbi:MAG: molybdopterin dinucleotide binding domain-containing protein, partial [Trebonia sp.]